MHLDALTEEGEHLFPHLRAFAHFYLAGGTALALQLGHRVSVDFDFFSEKRIPTTLLKTVENIFTGFVIRPLVNNREELTALINGVKVTFLHYPFPVLQPLMHYRDFTILSVPEIGATKAYTIGRRGAFKDYVDLYTILASKHATLAQIIALAQKKYADAFTARLFLEQLVYLDDVEDAAIRFLGKPVHKKALLSFFGKEIKGLKL